MNVFGRPPQRQRLDRERRQHLKAVVMYGIQNDGSSRRNIQRFVRPSLVGTAAAVLAIVLGTAVATSHGGDGPTGSKPSQQAIAIDVGRIAAQSTTAIERAHDVILHVTITGKLSTPALAKRELWLDQKAVGSSLDVGYDANGSVLSTTAVKVEADGSDRTRSIDPATKTVTEFSNPASTAHAIPVDLSYYHPSHGTTAVLDGVTTNRFSDTNADGVEMDIWVAVDSKLPVRRVLHEANGDVVMEFDWSTRTDSALAKLWPDVPAGYTVHTVDASQDDGTGTTSTTMPRATAGRSVGGTTVTTLPITEPTTSTTSAATATTLPRTTTTLERSR